MPIRLYDTASRTVRSLEIPTDRPIGIYVCGITPYDAAHMGHVFTFLMYDLLVRRLEDHGHKVRLVRNITDVDDPLYAKAAELGITYTELAAQETTSFQQTMDTLNIKQPDHEPRASQYIEAMAAAVQQLCSDDFGYRVDGDVYFDVSRLTSFGALSGYSEMLQLNLMRERGGDPERAGKRNPLDFLLWKQIDDPADPAAWDTVLGHGRPGWHIECSVMSSELLGTPIDLHGGGTDLIFPHHSCEIAQSESLGHKPFSKHWLHVAPMMLGSDKMSKSLGNLVFARDLLKDYSPNAIRLGLMQYHYRTGGEWRQDFIDHAATLARHIDHALTCDDGSVGQVELEHIRAALDCDLDTPQVVEALERLVGKVLIDDKAKPAADTPLRQALGLLGLSVEEKHPSTK